MCGCSFLLHFCDMFPAPESFCYKRFFQLCGLSSKTPKEIQEVFHILDDDDSGYFEESELKCVKQCCRECMYLPCRVMFSWQKNIMVSAALSHSALILDDVFYGMCRYFLQRFQPGARTLTEAETKSFISAADDDCDGRIGVEGWCLVPSYSLKLTLRHYIKTK